MVCDTRLKTGQTIQQRAEEVKTAAQRFITGLAAGRIKAVVDRLTGAVAFKGIADEERDGVTDACAYRRIMATGSALAKAEIAKAEMLAGRSVDKKVIAHGGGGLHSHDGGKTWHGH